VGTTPLDLALSGVVFVPNLAALQGCSRHLFGVRREPDLERAPAPHLLEETVGYFRPWDSAERDARLSWANPFLEYRREGAAPAAGVRIL